MSKNASPRSVQTPLLRRLFSTIPKRLALLLLAMLLPILIVQILIYRERFETRRRFELKTSMEIAHTMAETFQAFLDGLLNQELAIGLALSSAEPLAPEAIRLLLKGNKTAHPFLHDLSWVSPAGRVIAATDCIPGNDVSEHSFFSEIVSGREWAVSGLSKCDRTGHLIFAVSRAVRDSAGSLIGVVVVKVLADSLEAMFPPERPAHYDGDAISIIDQSGRLVVRSPRAGGDWESRNLLNRIPFLKEALAGHATTGTIVDAADGQKRILALEPIQSVGWALAASRLEDRALAPVYRYLGRHALMFSAVVLLSLVVFLLVADSISKPLKRLQAHTRDMGRGAVKALSDFKGPAELVKLAGALDFMAQELNLKISELRRFNDTLERRVAERTELADRRARQLQSLVTELTLAEQRERQRLAEILHDHLQQFLVAAKINAEVLSASIAANRKREVERVIELVGRSIEISRSLTAELSPPGLRQNGLCAALTWLAQWMQANENFRVDLVAEPGIDPEREDITVLLFLSVRELLLNVVKHAGVMSAQVKMTLDREKWLRVTVADRGRGFDPAALWDRAQSGHGFGILSIRERLSLMGGSLEVEGAPGRGAAFSLVVPADSAYGSPVPSLRRKRAINSA